MVKHTSLCCFDKSRGTHYLAIKKTFSLKLGIYEWFCVYDNLLRNLIMSSRETENFFRCHTWNQQVS